MEEDLTRPLSTRRPAPRRNYSRRQPPKKQGSTFSERLSVQIAVCILILIAVIAVRFINTPQTNNLQSKLDGAISEKITFAQAKEKLVGGSNTFQVFKQTVNTIFGFETKTTEQETIQDNEQTNETMIQLTVPSQQVETQENIITEITQEIITEAETIIQSTTEAAQEEGTAVVDDEVLKQINGDAANMTETETEAEVTEKKLQAPTETTPVTEQK